MSSLSAALPSTSSASSLLALQRSSFSTSSPAQESRKKRIARLKRKSNLDQRVLKVRMLEMSKPDPVLGHQPNQQDAESIWNKSELAKIILDKQTVWGVQEDRRGNLVPIASESESASSSSSSGGPAGTAANEFDQKSFADAEQLGGPRRLNFGLDSKDRELLFQDLPNVMVKDRILDSWNLGVVIRGNPTKADIDAFESEYSKVQAEEFGNKDSLSRILDLKNASGKGIQVENLRRIISHFGNNSDTGSPEVQAAVLTYRIRNLHEHLTTNRHDNSNRRAMSLLVHQRAKLLKYLKRKNPARYHSILPRIGIQARAVEGEIVVPERGQLERAAK
ncbi:hypothetical protein BCV70DRAFT_205773 [Testicularia cyperi]|uniref:S15/NS1 RNA-binding domain-containing protein n=1 Tax=Testicularia cyperi TaxID=1882483 RepID=A0A317XTR9_9BASI|nr:hypothetical protein BCV70DRAFT_205773 [Testicularia cyperi]